MSKEIGPFIRKIKSYDVEPRCICPTCVEVPYPLSRNVTSSQSGGPLYDRNLGTFLRTSVSLGPSVGKILYSEEPQDICLMFMKFDFSEKEKTIRRFNYDRCPFYFLVSFYIKVSFYWYYHS